jgi:hypothetical protein
MVEGCFRAAPAVDFIRSPRDGNQQPFPEARAPAQLRGHEAAPRLVKGGLISPAPWTPRGRAGTPAAWCRRTFGRLGRYRRLSMDY